MNTTELGIVALLKSAVTGQAAVLPEGFDLGEAEPVLHHHGIAGLGYAGAVTCGIPQTDPAMQRLFLFCCRNVIRNQKQLSDLHRMYEAFEAHGIDYMPVKGCIMKGLYPRPELRQMGDADILVKQEQYPLTRQLMLELGFREGKETDHELVWTTDDLMVELHKRLIPSYNQDYFKYYGTGWELAKRREGHRYAMTREDQLIYLFTHFAKHYRDGGIGLRHVLDLWIYLRTYDNLDQTYLEEELEKLQLLEFWRNICRLLTAWFEGGPMDEKTAFISRFLFDSGCWGSRENRELSVRVRAAESDHSVKKSLLRMYCTTLFPPIDEMAKLYPVLNRCAMLLPVLWFWRWIDVLLSRRDNLRRQLQRAADLKPEQIRSYEEQLDYVGLRFRFEE